MIDLGLSPAKRSQAYRLLHVPHSIHIAISVMNLQEQYTSNLSGSLMDGQVNVSASDQVTRSADLTFFDPFQSIQLDPNDPSRYAVGMADLVKIVYGVGDPETFEVFWFPLFCGPIDDVQRDGMLLKVTCVGKESLAVNNSYVGKIYKKGAKKTDVIRDILRNIMGETRYQIPDLPARLPNDWRLSQGNIPWDQVKALARGMGYQIFYDGRGICRMRIPGSKAVFTFNDYWVTDAPDVDWSTDEVVNTVIVKGGKPKKARTNVSFTAVAPAAHPLSPARLGRNGVPRYLYETIEDSSLMSVAECRTRANQVLNRGLLIGFDARWDGLPVPMLEEGDVVHLETKGLNTSMPLNNFSIPLTIGTASYGYNRSLAQRGGASGISSKQYGSYRKRSGQWREEIRAADRKARKIARAKAKAAKARAAKARKKKGKK